MRSHEGPDGGALDAVVAVLTTDDLHAYVDGEASPQLHDDVEGLMEEDPRAARWVAAYQHQIACMHRAFGADDEPVPERLLATLRSGAASTA